MVVLPVIVHNVVIRVPFRQVAAKRRPVKVSGQQTGFRPPL
jgi:hypothetical protein